MSSNYTLNSETHKKVFFGVKLFRFDFDSDLNLDMLRCTYCCL